MNVRKEGLPGGKAPLFHIYRTGKNDTSVETRAGDARFPYTQVGRCRPRG
jgi:hypothetical protein